MSFSNVARRFVESADGSLRRRLKAALVGLREDPRGLPGVKALHGQFAGHLGYRVGEHRIVYRVNDAERRVIVVAIGHRREVYR